MKFFLFALAAGLALASCVPSTPQTRIQRYPDKFDALGAEDKSLVQQGTISTGMTADAVYLAWGGPSRVLQGAKNGETTEQWDYAGSRPVYTTSFYGGYGYGGCGPYRARGYYGFAPEVTYIPYRIATVWFLNNRVDSWERER
jgi:hypothetical protein